MKRHALFVALLCIFALFIRATSYALTIPASEDSYTASGSKLNNLTNNANSLIVDATRKSYLYFDLSDIPADAVVRWAKLRLFLPTVRTAGAGLSVHLVTGTWNESSRLADVPSISTGSIGMIAPDKMASRRFVTVDVKDTVQKWINGGTLNEGFAIQPIAKPGSPTASVMLTSKEGPVFGLPAELDIEFQPEGGVDKPVTLGQLPSDVQALLNPQPVKLEGIHQLPSSLVTLLTPAITQQSQLNSWEVGLSVGARGVGLLRYQLLRNGVAVGTQSANSNLPISLSGTYSVVVSNEVASVISNPIVIEGPSIVQQPANLKVIAGAPATFQVVAGGTPPFTYQWRANGVWLQINTAQSQSLSLPLINEGLTANIDVIVRNGVGSITSGTANLKVVCGTLLVAAGTLPASSALGPLSLQPFYIGSTEVTYQRWETVRSWALTKGYQINVGTADGFEPRLGSSGLHAVTYVTWYDVVKWCNARSQMEGKMPVYLVNDGVYKSGETIPERNPFADGYRLPSEAEWEFAARGGIYTNNYTYSGSNDINAVAIYEGNSNSTASEVASKLPNELGLYDMSGSALEWCFDNSGTDARRVIRGGRWLESTALDCSVGFRKYESPSYKYGYGLGFRVALSPLPPDGIFALVTGGTLPASSPLGQVPVQTFYIGKTEVTWKEWQTVRAWAMENGYTDLENVGAGVGDNYPVTDVNWYDVVKWCNARSEKEGKTPVYTVDGAVYKIGQVTPTEVASANGYRLPGEKEWEFAARGGTQTQGYTYSGSNDLNAVGWYGENSGGGVHEVGKKLANELGICDMSGNLVEWSGSWYPGYEGSYRVIRGGGWDGFAEACTVAFRNYHGYPEVRYGNRGFRVATSGEYALGITVQPSVSLDGTKLSVEAAGAGTLTYQWMLNGGAIAGGTSSQLSTQGLQSGTYTVVVSNGFASKASGSIEVNVPKFFEIGRSGQPTASQDGRYYAIGNEDKIDIFENNGIKFHTVPMPGGRPYGNYELIGLSNNTGKLYLRTWNGYIIEGAGGVLELDVQTGSTKRVDVDSLGRIFTYQGWGVDRDAIDFSGNEQYVVMAIRDTEDSISWGTQEVNIYLKDLNSGRIQQIDPDEIGGYSSSPRVNSDGTKIVFISTKRLAPEATGDSNLYLWEDGVISLVNKSEAGTTFASAYGWAAGISGDGSKVVFQTGEALVPTDTNGVSDIYVKDIKQNKITRVSENNYGGIYPLISNDGTKIGFQTYTAPPVNESRIRLYSSSSQKTCEIPGVEATNKYQAVFHSESFVQLEDNTALIFTWKDYSRTDNNNDGDYYFIKGLNFLQPIQRETKSFYSLTDGRNGTPVESLSFVEPELGDEGQREIWFSRSGNLDKLDQMKITFLPRTAHRGTDYTEHQNYSGYNIVHLGLGQSSDGIAFYIHRDDLNESDEDFIFKIEPQDSSDSSAVGFEAVIRIINRN